MSLLLPMPMAKSMIIILLLFSMSIMEVASAAEAATDTEKLHRDSHQSHQSDKYFNGNQMLILEQNASTVDGNIDGGDHCEFSLQRVPGGKFVNIDRNGRKCEGELLMPLCRGLCKSSESGTHIFPFREQEAAFCGLMDEGNMKNVTLEHCEEGVEEGTQLVEIPAATECKCMKLP